MQKQDNLKNILLAGAVFIVVMAVAPILMPPPPKTSPSSASSTPATGSANSPDGQPTTTGEPKVAVEQSPTNPAVPPGGAAPASSTWTLVEAPDEVKVELGTTPDHLTNKTAAASPFRMHLELSNVGASIESATLTDHAEKIKSDDRYKLLSAVINPAGAKTRSFEVEKIHVDGEDVILRGRRWEIGKKEHGTLPTGGEGESVEFHLDLEKSGLKTLRLTRSFVLPAQPIQSSRHDFYTDIKIENLSDQPHRVLVIQTGGLGVPQSNPRMDDRVIDYATVNSEGLITPARKTVASIEGSPDRSLTLYATSSATPDQYLSWAATDNTYFTCTIAPLGMDGKSIGKYIVSVSAIDADGDSTTRDDATIRFVTAETTIAPGNSVSFQNAVYLGDKDGNAFRKQADYAARGYYFQISQGFGWCTFSWLVELMIGLLNGLHRIIPDYGVAIIILVLCVRALLHPITKKGQVNMVRMQHRMQTLQPKIEEIKRKYANDKVKMNQEMMKLDLNPAGQLMTCIPMFIQMPIWVALYLSLSNNIDMRHQGFLFTWIHDLTAPDALIPFASPVIVPILGWRIASFNLLPLLLTLFTYTQQKLQPKPAQSPNMTEQQRQQQQTMQNMVPIMSLMMLFIFYSAPSGLTLYVMASSLFGTIEQWWIRKHIREQEAAGTLHKPPDKKDGDGLGSQLKKIKPGWLDRIQKMAEESQKAQHSQRAKPKR
ncbi:MAG: YidC/Oxa1 family insertase periplasmic-domain containing protein [Planctomycetes bacterium]|nr:YidC/Oxa1 family insertase periplasmic-domain containing protein [Planctomycetota bacterium]